MLSPLVEELVMLLGECTHNLRIYSAYLNVQQDCYLIDVIVSDCGYRPSVRKTITIAHMPTPTICHTVSSARSIFKSLPLPI